MTALLAEKSNSLLERFQHIYPELVKRCPLELWLKWSHEYLREIEPKTESESEWQYFNMFLRSKAAFGVEGVWIDLASFEWARFASENILQENPPRLKKSISFNPQAQLVRLHFDIPAWLQSGADRPGERPRILIFIQGSHFEMNWQQAAILDEVLEAGEILREELLAQFAQGIEGQMFASALTELFERRVLLG